jgi:predicted dehydrogenase
VLWPWHLLPEPKELRFIKALFSQVHDIITSGRLGRIITVEHRENVVYWHMAHSFVRGNWCNSQLESPMILAKCCHDLDILYWNLGPVTRLNSFGSLLHYRPQNAPPGATKRCTDGCPVADDCPWYAPRLYLRDDDYVGWPISVISEDTSLEARRRALETGPYGRCVYHCDNDVVDHQTVNLEFESGATGVLFMHGHSHEEGRTMRYDGTRATLRGKPGAGAAIEIHDHLTGRIERVNPQATAGGHGGGDVGLMDAFVQALAAPSQALTTARESLESHLLAFAAEKTRVDGSAVHMNDFRRQAETVTQGGH